MSDLVPKITREFPYFFHKTVQYAPVEYQVTPESIFEFFRYLQERGILKAAARTDETVTGQSAPSESKHGTEENGRIVTKNS